MRAVVDTNVLLSGLLWHGTPHTVLERARDGRLKLVTTAALLDELCDVLGRAKFRSILLRLGKTPEELVAGVRQLSVVVEASPFAAAIAWDADDDVVLAAALAGQADLIISGDSDLLVLGSHAGVPIFSPSDAMDRLGP